MHFSSLTFSVAAVATLASAKSYPVTASELVCRKGPSTSDDAVTTYSEGDSAEISCQTTGTSVEGNNIWDKTDKDCYVADYYVKTGSDSMVTDPCDGGSGGDSDTNGEISRDEILKRGQYWIDEKVPYDMEGSYPDLDGVDYRTDCSGFVSMALHTDAPGYSTVSLPEIAKEIDWSDLQPGDFVGTLGEGTGGAGGHVVLFHSWTDDDKETYKTLECRGTDYGCVAYERGIAWTDGDFTSKPYSYTNVKD